MLDIDGNDILTNLNEMINPDEKRKTSDLYRLL